MAFIRLEAAIDLVYKGITYHYTAGDVINPAKYPGVERLIKEQKKKGRIEKNGV